MLCANGSFTLYSRGGMLRVVLSIEASPRFGELNDACSLDLRHPPCHATYMNTSGLLESRLDS
jgi:hypothetical protein